MAKIKLESQVRRDKDYHLNKLKQYYKDAMDYQKEIIDKYGAKIANMYSYEGLDTVAERIAKLERSRDFNLNEVHELSKILGVSKGYLSKLLSQEPVAQALADRHGISLEEATVAWQATSFNRRTKKYDNYMDDEIESTSVQRQLKEAFGWDEEERFNKETQAIKFARELLRKTKPAKKLMTMKQAIKKTGKKLPYVSKGTGQPKKAGKATMAKAAKLQAKINKRIK